MYLILRGVQTQEELEFALKLKINCIGFVFDKKNPRHINAEAARELGFLMPPHLGRVGFFGDDKRYEVEEIASFCRLQWLFLDKDRGEGEEDKYFLPVVWNIAKEKAYAQTAYYYADYTGEMALNYLELKIFLPWREVLKHRIIPQGVILDFSR
jgi:hypothetical protein